MKTLTTSSNKRLVQHIFSKADIEFNGVNPWDIQVHNEAFYSRLLRDGSLGLGESYMEGMWDCEDLIGCMGRILNGKIDEEASKSWPTILSSLKAKLFNMQNRARSMDVIHKHYQIGNDLYEKMLDPSLTYSCGYWKEAKNLAEAQLAKYDLICKKLQLRPQTTLLDIGCGWGGLAKFAAENYGVEVVGVTLSQNQAQYAQNLCKDLPVEIRIEDYRNLVGTFDYIVEIGMFEHVGAKNYADFMSTVHRCLKDEGLFLLHTIGSNQTTLITDPWINRYIFPNGQLPSISQIGTSTEGRFVMEDWHNFGPDYDKTLCAWFDNFNRNWDQLSEKYDPMFYRMWKYYLLSCAACFRSRQIQLWQVVFSKNGVPNGYASLR